MFHIEDVLQLKDDERVKGMVRRHVATILPSLALAMFLIVLPFFLLFPLFSWGAIGIILFFAAVVFGIALAMRTMVLWDADVLIVTTLRLVEVDQKGLLTRSVSEAALKNIQDVSWIRKGMAETLFRMGTVKIATASASTAIIAKRIPRPQDVSELINELRQPGVVRTNPTPVPEVLAEHPANRRETLKSIQAMLESYPDEELSRVETILKARARSDAADAFAAEDGKHPA
ncbi:MAG: PH domain-containing protein [Patescibacteria group bacterium]